MATTSTVSDGGAQATMTNANTPLELPMFTILLVEDDDVVRDVTREVLQQAGYGVLEACGPAGAMELAAEPDCRIDLLLTDFIMPGMDGLALATQLRQLHPGLTAVLMSGYAEERVHRRVMLDRKTSYIQKPFTGAQLCDQVARAAKECANLLKEGQVSVGEVTGLLSSHRLELQPPF